MIDDEKVNQILLLDNTWKKKTIEELTHQQLDANFWESMDQIQQNTILFNDYWWDHQWIWSIIELFRSPGSQSNEFLTSKSWLNSTSSSVSHFLGLNAHSHSLKTWHQIFKSQNDFPRISTGKKLPGIPGNSFPNGTFNNY